MIQVPAEFFARCSPDDPRAQRVGFEFFRFHDSECLALWLRDGPDEVVELRREIRRLENAMCGDCHTYIMERDDMMRERDDALKCLEAAQARIAELEAEYSAKEHQAA